MATISNAVNVAASTELTLGAAVQLLTALSRHFRVQGQDCLWLDACKTLSIFQPNVTNSSVVCDILDFLAVAVQRDERLCAPAFIHLLQAVMAAFAYNASAVEKGLRVMDAALDELSNLDDCDRVAAIAALKSEPFAHVLGRCLFEARASEAAIEHFADVCEKLVEQADGLSLVSIFLVEHK